MSVIVWEWQNFCKDKAVWLAYEPTISNFIEENYRKGKSIINLGHKCTKFSSFQLNLKKNIQITTYRERKVRREEYNKCSTASLLICWQWMDEVGTWQSYPVEVSDYIEKALKNKDKYDWMGLYSIDPIEMKQVNIKTNYIRKIQRHTWSKAYTKSSIGDDDTAASMSAHKRFKKMFLKDDKKNDEKRIKDSNSIKQVDLEAFKVTCMQSSFGKYFKEVKNLNESAETCPICCENLTTPSSFHQPIPPTEDPNEGNHNNTQETPYENNTGSTSKDKLHTDSTVDNIKEASTVIKLKKCGHSSHWWCLRAMILNQQSHGLQCPTCKLMYNTKYGNCPDGVMKYEICNQTSLPGFKAKSGVITITYDIQHGRQKDYHPEPHKPYLAPCFPRTAFLPNNKDGRRVLRLLIKAWERRLTFTIGTSVTLGISNSVVWNEIHHKTQYCNNRGHGYPDENYIDNVLMELKSQGVVESEDEEEEDGDEKEDNERKIDCNEKYIVENCTDDFDIEK